MTLEQDQKDMQRNEIHKGDVSRRDGEESAGLSNMENSEKKSGLCRKTYWLIQVASEKR